MRFNSRTLIFFVFLGCADAPEAPNASDATDGEAETCLRTKIWEANREGWSVRNSGTAQLTGHAHKAYAVNLYTSREYQFLACGAGWASEVELQLYTKEGARVQSVNDQGRQPTFEYSPSAAGQFFVVIKNANNRSKTGSISWTVLYR